MKGLWYNSPEQIPGWTFHWQHNYYPKLTEKLSSNSNVLEVGCGFGRSTWAWLNCLPEDCNFFILDNFSLDEKEMRKVFKVYKPQKEYFEMIISRHPKKSIIKEVYNQDYYDWIKTNNLKFDLVYLDSGHHYEIMKNQLNYFKEVTTLTGDDYLSDHPGVVKAVDEFVSKYNRKLTIIENFFIIEKLLI